MAKKIVFATEFVDVIGPSTKMLDTVKDGGIIIAKTEPACFGPMITPELKSWHTVTRPIAVEGATVGDGIAIKIRKINILSKAASSGTEEFVEGRYIADPGVAAMCPTCNETNPETYVKGKGRDAIRCKKCDSEINPFNVTCGYTLVFDEAKMVGVSVDQDTANEFAEQAYSCSALPPKALAHPVVALALADLGPGIITRVRPMIGNIGTLPAIEMPSSHNAGDFGQFLVGAPHAYGIEAEKLVNRSDSHMDINEVREGCIVIAPVKVDGGGIVVGDAHALQGDGEIAGHTVDVTAEVTLEVEVIKNLGNDGPILLPNKEDLPDQVRPLTEKELATAQEIAQKFGFKLEEDVAPIQVVGSGANLNEAIENGLERMSKISDMTMEEVKNRVTITGAIEIGRAPGVVNISMLLPLERLDKLGIGHLVREQYGL
ncbi:MAG: acetamidase/formamidase family protein [Candidatus Hydrothermarchaeota archaeon]